MSITKEDVVIHLSGVLNFATIPALNKKYRRIIEQHYRVTFDLTQVTSSDNTGVAFLVVLASLAKKLQREIKFVGSPPQLLDLIDAVGVRAILPMG